MDNTHQRMPQRLESGDLILEELRDELMIYDSRRNQAFCLNQTAAFVWKHADGNTTVAEMASRLGQQLDTAVDEQVIWFALDQFSKDGLLAPTTILPSSIAEVTRRTLLKKMGVGAIALPVVTSLLISPAKAHASSMAPSSSTPSGAAGGPPSIPPSIPPGIQAAMANHQNGGFWAWLENLF